MSSSVFTLTNRLNYLQAQVNQIIADSDTLQEVIDNGDALQGTTPTLNQVIKYDGTEVVWSDLPAPATPSLQEVITVNDDLQANAPTLDQVIKYDGTNVVWSDLPAPPATPSLQEVVNVSDVLNGEAPTGGQFIGYTGSVPFWSDLPAITLDNVVTQSPELDGSPPLINQVIQYDGEFVVWANLPAISTPSLQEVITVNDELQSTAPTLNQVIQYNGTNVLWSDLPVPATPSLQDVLSAGNTASGASASVSLTNLPKQTILSPTSVFLNDTTIVQQATLNTEKLRLLTSGLTNDITSSKMSFVKPATSSINEYGTDGVALSGLFGAETRSGGLNLNTGVTINNVTGKLTGTLNESFVSLDGNNSSTVLGTKSTLNATGLTCVNKVTPSTTSSLSSTALNIGNSSSTLTASPTGLSSTNILNLNSSTQIDTNCSIRVLATPPSSAGRSILSNGQLSIQNVAPALQNTISSTSSAITNGTKTISMTVDGLSSTGAMSLGTATVALTTGSTGITQTYPSNTTALATTQYVTTAINNIPASATPTLQSVTNQGNTITNGTKTLTLSVNGLDSTGEIVIGNVSGTTQLNGTTTATKLKSFDYDSNGPSLTVKLVDSLTTGNLELGNNITTGNINLGSKMTSGNLYMMNDALASGDITMLNPSATGKLLVRGGGISTNTITATTDVKTNSINATSVAQDLDIGSNLQDTTISIGRLMIADGRVEIGSTASTINLVSNDCNAVTQTTGNNTTRVATTAFVNSSISAISPSIPTLQQVLDANNTANKTIVLSDGNYLNDITPNQINITNDAGTEQLVFSNQTLTYTTDTGVSTLNNVGLGIRNTDNSINSNLTKDSLTFTATGGTNNSFSSSGAVLTGFVGEQLKNCAMTVEGGFFNRNETTLKESNFTESTLYLLDETNKTNRSLSLASGLLQEINTDEIALGTKSLLSDSTLTLINKETSEITTIIPSSSTITDGTNTCVVNNSGIGMVEPITNKSTYYNLNDFLISKTVGTVNTGVGSSSETLTLQTADSVLSTSSTNELTALGSSITDGTYTNSSTSSQLNITDGTNVGLLTNTALSFTLPTDVFAVDATNFSMANTGGTVSTNLTKENMVISNATNSITFNPLSFIYNTVTTNWADLVTNAGLALYASLAGTNVFTGVSNTFRNSVIVKASPIATISNTLSNIGSSLIDTGKSTYYNLDGLNIQKVVGPITSSFGALSDVINLASTDSSLSTSNNIQIASDYIYLTDETTFSNSITSDDIQISNGTLKTIYNSNSITSTDNLTINSASTKLLKIGSSSATENVEIASQAGRSVVLHLGDGINNIAGSGVHINNGSNSVGNTQINNGSGQTGQINIGNATSGTTTTNIAGITNINTSGTATTTIGIQSSTINMRGGVNINTSGTGGFSNTSIGLAGSVTSIQGTTNMNTTGGTTTIGGVSGGTTTISSPTINIGNADTTTTMNATKINQVMKTVGGSLIENTIGNTSIVPSMSVTFNRKQTTPVGGAINCYTITSNSADQFTAQYFEIYISGANGSRGAYTFKGCFGVEKRGSGAMTASSVSTLFYYGTGVAPPASTVIPVVDFSLTGQILTVRVNTSGGGSSTQNFVTTLTSYPTASIRTTEVLEDFIITAV